MSVADLAQAITLQEAGRLTRVPGIGKKTAERLLLELKGKLGADIGAASAAFAAGDHSSDILNALLALGYSDKEALLALKSVPAAPAFLMVSSWHLNLCQKANLKSSLKTSHEHTDR